MPGSVHPTDSDSKKRNNIENTPEFKNNSPLTGPSLITSGKEAG
jgi:hypothetical protein